MKESNRRLEKRPRIVAAPKREVVYSTDKVRAKDVVRFFADTLFKKQEPFAR